MLGLKLTSHGRPTYANKPVLLSSTFPTREDQMTDTATVAVPWMDLDLLSKKAIRRAYATCKRGSKSHCINSNLVRAFATAQGREVRYVQTYKGSLHWSENIDGQWVQYAAPLAEKYAKSIDAFDHNGQHFDAPKRCPLGRVRFVGFCVERHDKPEVIKVRKETMYAKIEAGKLVPGSRFRERQLPYVKAQV